MHVLSPRLTMAALMLVNLSSNGLAAAVVQDKLWSVETSIAARYFLDADGRSPGLNPARPFVPSPNGRRFFVLSRRGDLAADQNVYELLVFDTLAVTRAAKDGLPAPSPIAKIERRTSNSFALAISAPKWTDDSRYITFGSIDPALTRQPRAESDIQQFVLDTDSRAVAPVGTFATNFNRLGGGIMSHPVAERGDKALFVAPLTVPAMPAERVFHYPADVVTPRDVMSIVLGIREEDNRDRALGLFESTDGHVLRIGQVVGSRLYGNFATPLVRGVILRSGREAIVATVPVTSDARWPGYELSGASYVGPGKTDAEAGPAGQFMRVDLTTGTMRPLLDAPTGIVTRMGMRAISQGSTDEIIGMPPSALLSPNGKSVILVNTAVPIIHDVDRRTAYVVIYNLETGAWQPLTPLEEGQEALVGIHWLDDGSIMTNWRPATPLTGIDVVDHAAAARANLEVGRRRQPTTQVTFSLADSGWTKNRGAPTLNSVQPLASLTWHQPPSQADEQGFAQQYGKSWSAYSSPRALVFSNRLHLFLDESADQPQRLIAEWGKRRLTLVDLDPALRGVEIAKSRDVEWHTRDGQLHRGRLTLPPRVRPDSPPPLVVQIYAYMPNVFRPDGFDFTGYAKQALVARGMAVLELSNYDFGLDPPHELERLAANLEASIDELVKQHLVDPERMGVMGFSRGGFQARHALLGLTRYRFRAAAAHDSFASSLSNHLDGAVLARGSGFDGFSDEVAAVYGGRIWEKPDKWLTEAEDMTAYRSTGALLDVTHNPDNLTQPGLLRGYFSSAAPFLDARRPVEYMVLPSAKHDAQRPREREASLSATVDWMDFWLQGHEDPDPAKAGKYARWRELRADWARQQAWETAGHPVGSKPDASFKQFGVAAKQ